MLIANPTAEPNLEPAYQRGEAVSLARKCRHNPQPDLRELATEILKCLRGHLRELCLAVVPGGVVIHGVATSYYGKQLALHEVRLRCDLAVTANQISVEEVASPTDRSFPVGG
jgi:hypothetical protein